MALECEDCVLGAHPAAVVDDGDRAFAASSGVDQDSPSTCVNRIIDQLAHDRRGPLDDLTRSDLINDRRRENRDPGVHV